jgi:hypothetical protein
MQTKLSEILNEEDRDWRSNTITRMDGAAYHSIKIIKDFLS